MDGDRLIEILARDFPSRAFDLYFWRMYDSMVEKFFLFLTTTLKTTEETPQSLPSYKWKVNIISSS